jgi:hypothetical protein
MANFNITLNRPTNKPFNSNDLKPVFAAMESPAEVTSIPSPFATLHLHNLAFFAANAQRVQTPNLYSVGTGKNLYDKIISHTLDIYELLYNWEKLNLEQKGFSIELFSIPTEQEINNAPNLNQEVKDKHKNFRKTLTLFIKLYKNKLGITDGNEAFDCGYYLKYNDRIIAGTSPLTGFFVSASANYGLNGIQGIIPTDTNIVYLSEASQHFRQLANRDLEFRKFMCELIQNYSPQSFTAFKDYIINYKRGFEITPEYNNVRIDLKKFGFHATQTQLQLLRGAIITPEDNTRVRKSNDQNIIAIPDRYNNIYFRSLINIKESIYFNLKPEDYVANITQRKLLGQTSSWLSVNDFFQDNIVELQDAINTERFYCCKVIDLNGNSRDVKVLLPLKERYFEFFNYNNATFDNLLETRLNIKQVTADEYLATLSIPTATGNVNLQKKYSVAENTIVRLNGLDSLYLGVYPFVKDITTPVNNGFFRIFTYHSKQITSELKFFKDSSTGMSEIKNSTNDRYVTKRCYNHENFQEFPRSTFYALERHYFDNNYTQSADKDVNFEIIEITLIKDGFNCKALIVPKFINKEVNGNVGMLSVDFGTSNTNISIGINGANQSISDYDSLITNAQGQHISQVVMLHKPSGNTFGLEATEYGGTNENHFLSEFMPTTIERNHAHYKFSVPTVINLHEDIIDNRCVSLVHSNIPVAYYSKGLRKMGNTLIDKPYSTFKWVGQDDRKKSYATLFLDQLLLMARNTLIATGQNPANTIVVYSIPLSFNATEKNFYETLWRALVGKYFVEENLHKISESRSPYYASGHIFGADSSILLDVGGGSTDILFYQNNRVQATTSYAYAANALFSGNRNQNIFMKLLSAKKDDGGMADNMNSVEDSSTLQVCDVFNYRFAKREQDVKTAFIENATWQYLLTLHCSAILYHTIQNNKAILGDNVKLVNLLFSGNGSKLFKLLRTIGDNASEANFSNLVKKIVKWVYGSDTSVLNISFVDDNWIQGITINSSVGMKAATSIGSLCWKMKQDALVTTDPQIVAIGDENTVLNQTQLISSIEIAKYDVTDETKQKKIIDLVAKNFNNFLNGFLGTETQESLFGLGLRTFVPDIPISPANVRKIITDNNLTEQSIKDYHLTHTKPEHSVFFVPVQKLIEELSKYFAAN